MFNLTYLLDTVVCYSFCYGCDHILKALHVPKCSAVSFLSSLYTSHNWLVSHLSGVKTYSHRYKFPGPHSCKSAELVRVEMIDESYMLQNDVSHMLPLSPHASSRRAIELIKWWHYPMASTVKHFDADANKILNSVRCLMRWIKEAYFMNKQTIVRFHDTPRICSHGTYNALLFFKSFPSAPNNNA